MKTVSLKNLSLLFEMYYLFVRSKCETFYVFLKIMKTMHWCYKSSHRAIEVFKFFLFIENGENKENMCFVVEQNVLVGFYEFDCANCGWISEQSGIRNDGCK